MVCRQLRYKKYLKKLNWLLYFISHLYADIQRIALDLRGCCFFLRVCETDCGILKEYFQRVVIDL